MFNFVFVLLIFCGFTHAMVDNDPYRHIEVLSRNYQVEWRADHNEARVTFNVTVRTRGYVGFGINREADMDGGDIVIAGVFPNGTAYLTDRHVRGQTLEVDKSQDYRLEGAWENNTHTFISFSRPFETCDPDQDIPLKVEGDLVYIIWAYGETDTDISYHFQNRGSLPRYLLDPDLMPRAIKDSPPFGNFTDGRVSTVGDWKVWTMAVNQIVPPVETAYMCTFHKVPARQGKVHAVGFRILTEKPSDIRYIHHSGLHRCRPQPGVSGHTLFGPHVGRPAELCYLMNLPADQSTIPFQYCQEFVNGWGIGGRPNFLPDHVGIPLGETEDEYLMVQFHYDNPGMRADIRMKVALEIFYTETLREYDGGLMVIGTVLPSSPSIIIPPSSIDHINYGICSHGCTDLMIPESGINVFASILHTHTSGRGVRFQHVRNDNFLPRVLYDDNYNSNYQQYRIINPERTIFPGDTMMARCSLDTTQSNGTTVIGGLATRQSMCLTFAWYYPLIRSDEPYGLCTSDLRAIEYRDFIEIYNSTWSNELIENVVVDPPYNEGLLESQVANNIKWTKANRQRLQYLQRNLPQTSICPSLQVTDPNTVHLPNPDYEFESISPESPRQYEAEDDNDVDACQNNEL